MSQADELRRAYDAIAPTFARFSAIPGDPAPLIEKLAAHVGPTGLILDVGCGHGRDIACMVSRCKVLGVDLSFKMLGQARLRTSAPLAQMEMTALGLSDHIVDGIWCCAALLHLPKVQAPLALREFRRVIRPGGMLIITVQQGQHDGPRHSDSYGVSRHFSDYGAAEMASLLRGSAFSVRSQVTHDAGSVTWLQTVAVADCGTTRGST